MYKRQLEKEQVIREKSKADLIAKNEQLRANLLRSISHDLRTPLTSISGSAGILLSSSDTPVSYTHLSYYSFFSPPFSLKNWPLFDSFIVANKKLADNTTS